MALRDPRDDWHVKVIRPRIAWGASNPRAAQVGEVLSDVMLSREFALEDAQFQKIVPNEFVIEIHQENYQRNYQPIEERVLQQWRVMMLEQLATANSRQGMNYYQLGAPLRLEIHPVVNLKPTEVRIRCRVQQHYTISTGTHKTGDASGKTSPTAVPCLELVYGKQRWTLRLETVTIGRDEHCNIHLDMPDVQDKRLISAEHAHLRFEQGRYFIYDGSPDGRASMNGTFVNRRPIPLGGYPLKDGDEIILASIDPTDPRPEAPGVVTLRYRETCS